MAGAGTHIFGQLGVPTGPVVLPLFVLPIAVGALLAAKSVAAGPGWLAAKHSGGCR
jgi:hypothetical protein